ncbi:ADP-glyceromanno-heptose 6-epimerase [Rhizobium phaseoli]|uniref:ADP-glyceromanno-heptose 6-epimerase n=1 Tax=Rhizobium phaseoli TaxID=396 RepID=UPI000D683B0B|nr:ADP-glyceromanno-heptose 6-epimerase [Rhizobium phaseoli]PWI54417.1 ADP-glyceromanno-heptose 6-epimerase [Rhizobium phaseoli]
MIIVTGGAGFIGSNLVHGLNSLGRDDIIVVDTLMNAKKHLNLSGARFIDYFDKDEIIDAIDSLKPVEAVFHQGACTVTTEQDGRYMMRTNYTFSRDLLHECLRLEIPFIYASSAAVYGTGDKPFAEADNERPLNIYGFSKLAFDQHVRCILSRARSPVVGLRYFNVYGPGEVHKGNMASLVQRMFEQHRAGRPLNLFQGSKNFRRDFIHVSDVVKVNFHFFERKKSGIFNCGTGSARSFQELGDLVAEQFGGAAIEIVDMPPQLEAQYQKYTCSDNSMLNLSGYKGGFVALEDGVKSYIEAMNQQRQQ